MSCCHELCNSQKTVKISFNPFKPSGKYMYHLLYQSVTVHFCVCGSYIILNVNSVNQLMFVMVKCGVLFEVRTGFLKNI
jgi:hypothetical protein